MTQHTVCDPDAGREPTFHPPKLACDAHFHVFGAAETYPYGGELRYKPPLAPLNAYMALAHRLGFERFVFVQPSAYGTDNSCMLDTMRAVGHARCRGIVDIDAEHTSEATLAEWHTLGVRGFRVNVSPVRPFEPGLAESMLPRIHRLADIAQDLGWHLDFLAPGWLVTELMPVLRKLPVDFTLAHMGLFPAKEGVTQPGFQGLLDLLRHGEGRCWVKLTGVYRMSTAPGFADAAPLAQALIETAPDRLIWGSDYPHLSFHERVGSIQLFNLLGQWASDKADRERILVENPRKLFGFG